MSSILKALKKIEGRKVDVGLPSWSYGSDSPESVDSHVHRRRWLQKVLGVLIILCGMALAGKLYFGWQPAIENTIARNDAPPVATVPQESSEKKAPEAPGTSAPVPKKMSAEAPSPARSEQVSAESPPTAPRDAEAFAAPPPDNAGLSLMALAWSSEPEARFVVINGKILQEGADVGESTVVRIEEEYVVMRTGGVTWKLQ